MSIRICSYAGNLCLHSPRLLGIFYKFFFNKRSFLYKVLLETLLFSVEIWSNDSIIQGQTYNFTQEKNSFWEEHEVALFSADYMGHSVMALTPAAQSFSSEKNSFVLIARYQSCFQFSFLNSHFSYYGLIISNKAGNVKSVMICFLFYFVFTTHLQVLNKILPN